MKSGYELSKSIKMKQSRRRVYAMCVRMGKLIFSTFIANFRTAIAQLSTIETIERNTDVFLVNLQRVLCESVFARVFSMIDRFLRRQAIRNNNFLAMCARFTAAISNPHSFRLRENTPLFFLSFQYIERVSFCLKTSSLCWARTNVVAYFRRENKLYTLYPFFFFRHTRRMKKKKDH